MYLESRQGKYQDNRQINTRKYDGPVLTVPPFIKTKSQSAVWYRGSSEWNDLDPELRSINTYNKFKLMQKNLMKDLLL